MGRTVQIQNSLNSGELSEHVDLRDDYDRYRSGVREMKNFVPLPYGGARTRFGLQWIAQTKDNGVAYLIPFEVSVSQAYIIEAGNLYFRFYKDGGRIASSPAVSIISVVNNGSGLIRVETSLATPWITGDYVSISGVVGVPTANQEWVITKITATTFDLQGSTFAGAYVSGGSVYQPYQITTPYVIADIPALKWAQYENFLYIAHPTYAPRKLTTAVGVDTGFSLNVVDFIDGPYMDVNKTATTITPSATTGSITLTASAPLFNANHVGSLWRLFIASVWGYAKVTGFTSTTVVNADVINTLGGASATANWREGSWSTHRGFPACNTMFEQRLCWASTPSERQTIWMSTTGSREDMTPSAASGSVAISDAVTYKLGSGRLNDIRWMVGAKNLFIGTVGEEFALSGAADAPVSAITPPIVTSTSTEGCENIQAVRMANQNLFVQRTGREVRANKFDFVTDDFLTQEVTLIAEHLLRSNNLTRLSIQNRPDHNLWAVRNDGAWLSFTYYPIEQVQGWAEQGTNGEVIDIATIPSVDRRSDQSWYTVTRTINGVTRRFVEMQNFTIQVDAGLAYLGTPVTSVSGLQHLEGETVRVVGDGAVYDDQIVSSGSVTLQYGTTIGPAASNIYVGKAILPNPRIVTLPPAYKDDKGVVRGRFKHWATAFVSLINTMGLTINKNKQLQYRKPVHLMDAVPPSFTGDKQVANLGWSRDGSLRFEQELPLPATIRGYFGDLDVGD